MRIGLDLDGVIVDSIPGWIALMNQSAGTSFALDELPDTYGSPHLDAFCDAHLLQMLIAPNPVPGAREALVKLREAGHSLVAITARTPRVLRLTEAWLEYFQIPAPEEMHFLEGGDKAGTARQSGIDLMVEDAPHNALAVAGAGVPVLLFGAPYNAQVQHPLIHRCDGWSEVLKQIGRRSALSA